MSWKNIKDHYRIGHQVKLLGRNILIGSPYVSDLITVYPDGAVKWGRLGPSQNDDLARYYAEMTADPAKLRELIASPDTFTKSLPVFTYDGGEIIEKQCEAYGWPNVTHDGMMQYDNSFSADKAEVVAWAKRNALLGVKYGLENITEAEAKLAEERKHLAEEQSNLEKLNRDFPETS